MTSIQERLQIKREPLDKWSIREQLCLAVARMNDQNLTSVSRALKPFGEPNRPADWFHQKNCAAQYGALLANVETPKRKKRTGGVDVVETPAESILRKLSTERKAELQKLLAEEKAEYLKLQEDMTLLQSGKVSEDQLDIWCKEIDEEEYRKEREAVSHAQWLKERELKKQEIERAWRPVKPVVVGQKRKNSESIDSLMEANDGEEHHNTESQKPALSPLLTSLLKSPSQVQTVSNSPSILHSAITSQRSINTNASPTIASLLNSSTTITVSPGIQQLVSSAIGQEPTTNTEQIVSQVINTSDMLDDQNLSNIKIDDLASSILVQDGPLPEIKNDVDGLISDLIDNAQDIVEDPEQHLQLDGNGDINLNLELDDLEENEEPEAKVEETKETEKVAEKAVDPFEFQEDPEVFEPTKTSIKSDITKQLQYQCQEKDMVKEEQDEEKGDVSVTDNCGNSSVDVDEDMVERDNSKDVDKTETEAGFISTDKEERNDPTPEDKNDVFDDLRKTPDKSEEEIKKEVEISIDVPKAEPSSTLTSEFNEELYDDLTMEVKVDKSGKAKRDYSRTKKKDDKEDKDFDNTFLGMSKREESDLVEDSFSDFDKDKSKTVKSENERSSSPWTEEEDLLSVRTKRRLSTPATPIDSVPNSPASSIAYFDDDRDYKNWKKSVMLVYNRLATNKYASLFLKPITDDQAPGYHSVVYRPMDLSTIRKNIENGTIRTTQEFQRDVMLMLNNAIMFNKTNDTVYNMTRQMQQESMQQIQILLQAQSQNDAPLRRETRTSEPGAKRKRGAEEPVRNKKRKED